MLARPLFSCFHIAYDFAQLQPESANQPLPDGCLSELALCCSLFALWAADLSRPWLSVMTATDASGSHGFGMCMSKCSPALSRQVAAAAGEGDMVARLHWQAGDPPELPRNGDVFRLPLSMDDFTDVFSIKADYVAHSGALELEAVRLSLLRLTRVQRRHGHRGVVLADAKVVGSALLKGRTSARTLTRGCSSCGAIQLAADLRLVFPYLPSESNPADWPSRGKTRKRGYKPTRRSNSIAPLVSKSQQDRRALRRLRQCAVWD